MTSPDTLHDVLIVGAGMAGLTAARSLAESGLRVLVLEAQSRIGGRILTHHFGNEAFELGAEFIHGRSPELWALIAEAGLETYERDGEQLCFEDGKLTDCADRIQDAFDPLEKLEAYTGPDLSFAEYLRLNPLDEDETRRIVGYVEGFNAADHREISAISLGIQQRAEDSIEGDLVFRLRKGYDQLPAYLADRIIEYKGSLQLNSAVREIRWRHGNVEAITSSGIFTATRAVITLPLALLQNESVSITPRPEKILQAVSKLRMGQVRRFTLAFRDPFWASLPPQPAAKKLSFIYAFSQMPPVWWTPHPEPSNSITGWIGGPRSQALTGISKSDLVQLACDSLAHIFSVEPAHIEEILLDCHTHDWQNDPFALGAYSYVGAGGIEAPSLLSEPVDQTLFFAGEHTDTTGHWGTVHAAMRSGLRAAQQVLNSPGRSVHR